MFNCDFHVHTVYSGHSQAGMTPENILRAAAEKELRQIVILEHLPTLTATRVDGRMRLWPGPINREHLDKIISETNTSRPLFPNLTALVGAEVDAAPEPPDGKLIWSEFSGLDLVYAAIHHLPECSTFWFERMDLPLERQDHLLEKWFLWIEKLARNPQVNIIAHPGVLPAANGWFETFNDRILSKIEPFLQACAENKIAVELNEQAFAKMPLAASQSYFRFFGRAIELGVKIAPATDSHHLKSIGVYHLAWDAAYKAGLKEEHLFHPDILDVNHKGEGK